MLPTERDLNLSNIFVGREEQSSLPIPSYHFLPPDHKPTNQTKPVYDPEVIKEMEGDEWDIVPSRDSNLDGCYAVMWRPEPEDGVRYTPNDGMFCQWQTIVHMWLLGKLKSLSC
jgi:hypothetical protein